jgi:hypothetical protein
VTPQEVVELPTTEFLISPYNSQPVIDWMTMDRFELGRLGWPQHLDSPPVGRIALVTPLAWDRDVALGKS